MPAEGIIDDSHPYIQSLVGKLGTKPANETMFDADLLIPVSSDYPDALISTTRLRRPR